jgi:hypothetical protein
MSIHAYAAPAARARLEPFEYLPMPLGPGYIEVAVTRCATATVTSARSTTQDTAIAGRPACVGCSHSPLARGSVAGASPWR